MKKKTSTVRHCKKSEPDPLLRATKKTFNGLSSERVANWIKHIMSEAGLDVMAFKAHSYIHVEWPQPVRLLCWV
jgi:hypothetical protein